MSNYNAFAALDSDDEEVTVQQQVKSVEELPKQKAPVKESKSNGKVNDEKRKGNDKGRQNKNKREYERRSGTGRGRETAKNGAGAHNWGNEAEDAAEPATGAWGEADVQEPSSPIQTTNEPGSNENENVVSDKEDEEENKMTLDEYLSKKQEERAESEYLAPRAVRKVTNEFKSAVAISKDDKTPDFMEPMYEKVHTKKTSGRKKQIFEDVGFRAPFRGGSTRGREGRGGARGGRRDFAERKERNEESSPVAEQSADRVENNAERERRPERRHDSEGRGSRGGRGRGSDRGRRGGRGRGQRGGRSDVPNASDMNAFPSLS